MLVRQCETCFPYLLAVRDSRAASTTAAVAVGMRVHGVAAFVADIQARAKMAASIPALLVCQPVGIIEHVLHTPPRYRAPIGRAQGHDSGHG